MVDRIISKLQKVHPVFFIFAVALIICWPILFSNKIFSQAFVVYTHYPIFKVFGEALMSGEGLTLWFSSYMSGFPAYLSQQGGLLSPLSILFFKLFSYIEAYSFATFFNFLMAGIGMYSLGRALSLSKAASFISSLTYAFSQLNIWYSSWLLWSNLFAMVPILFLCVLKIREGRYKYVFWGALALAIGWFGAPTENVFYVLLALWFFVFFIYLKDKKIKSAVGLFLICFLGTAVAIVWIVPVFNFTALTWRTGGIESAEQIMSGSVQLGDLMRLFYPYLDIPYLPLIGPSSNFVRLYVGILPLFLGLVSFLVFKKDKMAIFFGAMFLATFSFALSFSPLFGILHRFPIFKLFRGPFKWLPVAIFSFAVLVGYGFHYAEEIFKGKKFKVFTRILEVFSLFIVVLSVLINIIFTFFAGKLVPFVKYYFENYLLPQKILSQQWVFYEDRVISILNRFFENISFVNYNFSFSLIFIVISVAVLSFYERGKLNFCVFRRAVIVIIALNFAFIAPGFLELQPDKVLNEIPQTAKFLNRQESGKNNLFRVFGFFPNSFHYKEVYSFNLSDEEAVMNLNFSLLFPNTNMLYGLDSIAGLENFSSMRQSKMLIQAGFEYADLMESGANLTDSTKPLSQKLSSFTSLQNLSLLSSMNVKYLLSSFELPKPLTKVFETKVTKYNIPVYIYENSDV
ncbi:MAG: hypothetical protein Q7R75_00655, partial [bacterium]|nr:hypothetical protein [bacterium]